MDLAISLVLLSKLDYIQSLGVDAVWLCPTYDGPQVDIGYDITNFRSVYPQFGTLDDMDQLVGGCHVDVGAPAVRERMHLRVW